MAIAKAGSGETFVVSISTAGMNVTISWLTTSFFSSIGEILIKEIKKQSRE